jgi:hypothetical protein
VRWASATRLPFGDGAFQAALAVMTVHHWPDRPRGLAELAFAKLHDSEPGLCRLRRDLADGTWHRRHADLHDTRELDLGYRLVIARRR